MLTVNMGFLGFLPIVGGFFFFCWTEDKTLNVSLLPFLSKMLPLWSQLPKSVLVKHSNISRIIELSLVTEAAAVSVTPTV